ncbi:MAG: hypothetical protein NDF52_00575 [archaeon YNP-WB-062]|jgi:hypothetical protein|nr:hypothetical protein [Candidatus Culexarchaeum yellowstonense]
MVVEFKSVEFSLLLVISIIVCSSFTYCFGIIVYGGVDRLKFESNRLTCALIYSSINGMLSLASYSGVEDVELRITLPYRLSSSPYVLRLVNNDGCGVIIVGEGESAYSISLPPYVRVSESYLKVYGGTIILKLKCYGGIIEISIHGG